MSRPVVINRTDDLGLLAMFEREDGTRYAGYLTHCCEAAVTGVSLTADNPEGLACKGCYRPQPAGMLREWESGDVEAWRTYAGRQGVPYFCDHTGGPTWDCFEHHKDLKGTVWMRWWAEAERGQ